MALISWKSAYENHHYEPLYLANGTFGGMLNLSGVSMNLWSSRIVAAPQVAPFETEVLYPVTALRTLAAFRNPYWKAADFWVSRDGLSCKDPNYTANASMPHVPQVYHCSQDWDTRKGIATTRGTLFPGSQAALEAEPHSPRAIAYETRVAFLKDSNLMGIHIQSAKDTEIRFAPETILKDQLVVHNSGRSIVSLGSEVNCALEMSQAVLSCEASEREIHYRMQPGDEAPYDIVLRTGDGQLHELDGRFGFHAQGGLFCTVEIRPAGDAPATDIPLDAEAFFSEQARRWASFHNGASVQLPASESLWQERYEASLCQVAQSMGDAPIHPVGLSKPMLPYWYGCFHDTDTYFCRPLLERGHFEEAQLHLNFRHRTLNAARIVAQEMGRSGAMYPWETDPKGGGEIHEVPINSAIIACEAWHQHLYSGTEKSLQQAREICRETLLNLSDLINLDAQPLAMKPEPMMTFSETMRAEDPTEARIGIRAVAAAVLASEHPDQSVTQLAERILAELPLPESKDYGYAFGHGDEPEYLRCPSISLGSFPLHHLPADEALRNNFKHELKRIVFLFAWLPHQASVVASQLRLSEGPTSAPQLLRNADSFYKTWHAYDEWENRRTARAAAFVTAAGGFCTAIHAMLLAETAPGIWSLFPGIPEDWQDVAFENLRTRNGWKVSAEMKNGQLVNYEARPTHQRAAAMLTLDLGSHRVQIPAHSCFSRRHDATPSSHAKPPPPPRSAGY